MKSLEYKTIWSENLGKDLESTAIIWLRGDRISFPFIIFVAFCSSFLETDKDILLAIRSDSRQICANYLLYIIQVICLPITSLPGP